MDSKLKELAESIKTGFINKEVISLKELRPQLVINDKASGKKVLSILEKELSNCDEFWFSVAFITTSGVATIINALRKLQVLKIKGKILTSQYLNFTQPEALRRLKQFDNVELRIATDNDFHSKGYLFKKGGIYNLIIGSSNLTAPALSENKEWNLKISASEDSDLINKTIIEFKNSFLNAKVVDEDFIARYELDYKEQYRYNEKLVEGRQILGEQYPEPNKMQIEALANIAKLRKQGQDKALLISATGTGKTYLSAFDAKRQNPKKFLFVVHRTNIAQAAMKTFLKVFGNTKTMGLYNGASQDLDHDFIFATVQTISKKVHLLKFSPTEFEYIVIDETHRAGAVSYQRLADYFKPKFLLGMSATPERTDGYDVFRLFNNAIAYEIRLHRALEEKMLAPFHYYGITDLYIDGKPIDDKTKFNRLLVDDRVDHIINNIKLFGCDDGNAKGLVFCSRVEESVYLAQKFNERGLPAVSLNKDTSEQNREKAIEELENETIKYIFTVDIFNEGVDIPSVNQIILLRPTKSAIIFIQQLGRGLRKTNKKEYLTVIDFIGNYYYNFLVPIALFGDSSYNKDTLRKLMTGGNSLIPGSSTVNFDEISKERIFKAIDTANLKKIVDLRNDYRLLKFKLGRVPKMVDFVEFGSRDPWSFVEAKKSYYNFVFSEEPGFEKIASLQKEILEYYAIEINNGKRVEESFLLKCLIDEINVSIARFKELVFDHFKYEPSTQVILSCISNLNLRFVTKNVNKKLVQVSETLGIDLLLLNKQIISLSPDFQKELESRTFKEFLIDNADYSISLFKKDFKLTIYYNGFILYKKYSRKDVFRILNWDKNPNPQTVGGYMVGKKTNDCAIFVTYHKSEDIDGSIKYEDRFITPSLFQWVSKSNRTLRSPEVISILADHQKLRIPLFVKKDDDEGSEFYYMGELAPIKDRAVPITMKNKKNKILPAVKFELKLNQPVDDLIYEYITNVRNIEEAITK